MVNDIDDVIKSTTGAASVQQIPILSLNRTMGNGQIFNPLQAPFKANLGYNGEMATFVFQLQMPVMPNINNWVHDFGNWLDLNTSTFHLYFIRRTSDKIKDGRFVFYDDASGAYVDLVEERLGEIIDLWLLVNSISVNSRSRKECFDKLRNYCFKPIGDFDPRDKYLIHDKKVVDSISKTVRPFDEKIDFFTKLIPRHHVPVDPISKLIIENVFLKIPVPQAIPKEKTLCGKEIKSFKNPIAIEYQIDQSALLRRWLTNLVWLDFSNNTALLLVGNPNASKTLITGIVYEMLGPLAGAFQFEEIGEHGGLAIVYDKCIAVQNEGQGGYFNDTQCAKFKDIMSDGFKMPVRNLYGNPFEACVKLFMCIASNNLPTLSDNFENSSIYKRLTILFCPNQFSKCQEMQDIVHDSTFIDQVFSYLLEFPSEKVATVTEDIWWHRNEMLYLWSSRPLHWIMNEMYERCTDCDGDEEPKIRLVKIVADLTKEYKKRDIPLPPNFRAKIKKEAERMGGTAHDSSKAGDYIVGIREKFECPDDDPYNTPEPTRPKTVDAMKTLVRDNKTLTPDERYSYINSLIIEFVRDYNKANKDGVKTEDVTDYVKIKLVDIKEEEVDTALRRMTKAGTFSLTDGKYYPATK